MKRTIAIASSVSLAIWAVAPLAACDTPGGGRSSVATDAAATTPTTTTRDASTSSGDANGDGLAVCARWKADRADLDEGSWTGSTQSCDAGALLEPGHGHALAQVNLYRFLAGLPPVAEDATKSEAAQACALLMHANNDIQHVVPTSWHCFDQIGASAAGLSNLATTPAVSSIDLYITDEDIPTLGHRRWVLSNSLGPIGIGSTSRFSCLHVIGGDGRANARWTAWPPPGDVPYEALEHGRGESTDAAGWSVQSDAIDLRGANVTVTRDGTELDVQVRELASGYGSTFGLGIDPVGWQTEPGATYHVAVRGLSEDLDWDVHVVSCQ